MSSDLRPATATLRDALREELERVGDAEGLANRRTLVASVFETLADRDPEWVGAFARESVLGQGALLLDQLLHARRAAAQRTLTQPPAARTVGVDPATGALMTAAPTHWQQWLEQVARGQTKPLARMTAREYRAAAAIRGRRAAIETRNQRFLLGVADRLELLSGGSDSTSFADLNLPDARIEEEFSGAFREATDAAPELSGAPAVPAIPAPAEED